MPSAILRCRQEPRERGGWSRGASSGLCVVAAPRARRVEPRGSFDGTARRRARDSGAIASKGSTLASSADGARVQSVASSRRAPVARRRARVQPRGIELAHARQSASIARRPNPENASRGRSLVGPRTRPALARLNEVGFWNSRCRIACPRPMTGRRSRAPRGCAAISVHHKWRERGVQRRRREKSSQRSRTQHDPHSSKLQLFIRRAAASAARASLVSTPFACFTALVRNSRAP